MRFADEANSRIYLKSQRLQMTQVFLLEMLCGSSNAPRCLGTSRRTTEFLARHPEILALLQTR